MGSKERGRSQAVMAVQKYCGGLTFRCGSQLKRHPNDRDGRYDRASKACARDVLARRRADGFWWSVRLWNAPDPGSGSPFSGRRLLVGADKGADRVIDQEGALVVVSGAIGAHKRFRAQRTSRRQRHTPSQACDRIPRSVFAAHCRQWIQAAGSSTLKWVSCPIS